MEKSRYTIDYRGKKYTRLAASAIEAMEKFARHKVFGSALISTYWLTQYDARTRGQEWVEAKTYEGYRVVVSREE